MMTSIRKKNKNEDSLTLIGIVRVTVLCLIFVWNTALMSGCSVFEPREAQPPRDVAESGVSYVPPNDASGVFANLKSGIENLLDGANYKRSLSEDFNFIALLDDQVDLGTEVYENWSKEVEEDVLDFMLAGADTIEVEFNPSVSQDETDFVQFRVEYFLRLVLSGGGGTEVYRAVAEFDMRRIGGQWELDLWKEIEPVGDFTSWGYLKGQYRDQIGF
jgi:hypothetical protein